jgi:hypothetical protein
MNHRRSDPAKPERMMKGLPFGQNPKISPYMLQRAAEGGIMGGKILNRRDEARQIRFEE